MDFLNVFQEMQQKLQDVKGKLDEMTVEAEAGEGNVRVTVTGNRLIKNIDIREEFLREADKEELEDLTLIAINRGMKKAEELASNEMKAATGGLLPNIPGLFG